MSEDNEIYISVPTYSPSKQWHYTDFATRDDLRDFVTELFKDYPDENDAWYEFDETTAIFNEYAKKFKKNKMYCDAPRGSKDYKTFWRTMKERCKKGVIVHNDKGKTWYLTRFYYHWINFLKIYNKELGDQTFPDVLDAQYHVFLYEELAKLHYKHALGFKKRQFAWSYMHTARLFNQYIFDRGFIGKMGASDKKYIDDTGSWKFLNEYRDFSNEHTGWYRPNFPEKPLNWKQQQEITTSDGKKLYKGTKAKLTGHTFDKSPTASVGGATDEFFYEESGIAPTLSKTYGYVKPAMEYGMITTGLFIAGGSVGELTDAQDLHKFLMNPRANGFYAVKNNLIDKNGTIGETALFIPEQWAMPPCIDQYGNSQVSRALGMLNEKFKQQEKEKDAADYQLEVSQHPRNIEEGFAIRTVSKFPAKHTVKQVKRIEDNKYYLRNVELHRNEENRIVEEPATREPCQYPTSMKEPDKRGCVVIHEGPGNNPEFGIYYFSVDPIEVGKSDQSESLAAIYIYMNPIEITRVDAEGNSTTFMEGDKLVAEWVGRYDDPNETNEQMSLLVEYYNAWGISENNKTSFNNYMMLKNRTRHLAPADQMLFDKELGVSQNVYQKFGWSKSGSAETGIWNKILGYGVNWLSEVLDEPTDETGKVIYIKYGVERIPFIWLLKEMQQYQSKGNYDRIIAYCALIAFARIQQAAQGIKKKVIREETKLSKQKTHTFDRGMVLKSVGRPSNKTATRSGNPFRSIGR